MADKNIIVAGAYKGAKLVIRGVFKKELRLEEQKLFNAKKFTLNRQSVLSVDVVDTNSTKSASSAVLRAGVGAVLLGPIGLAAGLSAKNKQTHQIFITFTDNKESIALVSNDIFLMLREMFLNSQGVDKNFDFYEGRRDIKEDEPEEEPTSHHTQPPASDISAQLTQLAALKNAGALTDEEFAAAKARLLGGSAPQAEQTKIEPAIQDELYELYNVVLAQSNADFSGRIELIKAMRNVTGLGMREAKEAADNVPATIARSVTREKAEQICDVVSEYGGAAEIKKI